MPRIAVCGSGEAGKTVVANLLAEKLGLRFKESTSEAAAKIVFARLESVRDRGPADTYRDLAGRSRFPYANRQQAWEDRRHLRDFWEETIAGYNRPDKARLYREMLDENDIIEGIRRGDELAACLDAQVVDLVIWVKAEGRGPSQSRPGRVSEFDCDLTIVNPMGDMGKLHRRLDRLIEMGVFDVFRPDTNCPDDEPEPELTGEDLWTNGEGELKDQALKAVDEWDGENTAELLRILCRRLDLILPGAWLRRETFVPRLSVDDEILAEDSAGTARRAVVERVTESGGAATAHESVEYELRFLEPPRFRANGIKDEGGESEEVGHYGCATGRNVKKALDVVAATRQSTGGGHYKDDGIEPIAYIHANGLDFSRGSAIECLTRDRKRGGAEDVRKALHYCATILEMDYGVKVPLPADLVQ